MMIYLVTSIFASFHSALKTHHFLALPLPLSVFWILTRHRVFLSSGSRFGLSAWMAWLVSFCVLRASPTSSVDGETDVKPSFFFSFCSRMKKKNQFDHGNKLSDILFLF